MNSVLKHEAPRRRHSPLQVDSSKFDGRRGRPVNPERRLLESLKEGDQDAIGEIISRYHDKLFAVANRICNNPADAEEILQDVYMIALKKIDRFEERSTLSTWLYRITVNAALMRLRSQRANKSTLPIDGYAGVLGEDENVLRSDEAVRSPDETFVTREMFDRIMDSVGNLPEIYQSVFLLRDVQGYSIKETSKMLATTPAAIKSRLHRSRFFLREKLGEYMMNH